MESHYPLGPGGPEEMKRQRVVEYRQQMGPGPFAQDPGGGSRKVGLSCQGWLEFGAGRKTMRFQGSPPVPSVDERGQSRRETWTQQSMAHFMLEELRGGDGGGGHGMERGQVGTRGLEGGSASI